MAKFKDSLKVGKSVEYELCEIIKTKYPKAHVVEGYEKRWDIFIPEKDYGVEVKLDEKSHFIGNFVVEVEFDGKPSALSTTEAEWWIFVDKERYYWVNPESIRHIIREAKLKTVKFTGKGDNREKEAYLVPKEVFNSPYVIISERKK